MLGRLRETEKWPSVDAIAITHFHLDHWGDLVPWVWGTFYLATNGPVQRPALWVQPGGKEYLTGLGERLGFPDMFERVRPRRVRARHAFPDRQARRHADASSAHTLQTARVPCAGRTALSSRIPATRRLEGSSPPLVTPTSSSARRPAPGRPRRRAGLSLDECVEAYEASGAKRLLVTHRPCELPGPEDCELAYDGLEIDV